METCSIVQKYIYKKEQFTNEDDNICRLSIDMPDYMIEDFEIFIESLNQQIRDCKDG